MNNIAIFASGSGTNAQKIMSYFKGHSQVRVCVIFTHNSTAGVIQRAKEFYVPIVLFNRTQFNASNEIIKMLSVYHIDLIVLAGFLWRIPPALIVAFDHRIINIHPSLLPLYGGKGMYGKFVHQAVILAKEKQSGITIHYVNDDYDKGSIIAQYTCSVEFQDRPEDLAAKIHQLEHHYFPLVIERLLLSISPSN